MCYVRPMKPLRACLFTSALTLSLASGCGAPVENLVTRAQFDLDCPERELRVHTLDDKTRGVTGCGKRATYIEMCDMTGMGPINCRWVLNSPGTPAPTSGVQVVPPPAVLPPPPPAH